MKYALTNSIHWKPATFEFVRPHLTNTYIHCMRKRKAAVWVVCSTIGAWTNHNGSQQAQTSTYSKSKSGTKCGSRYASFLALKCIFPASSDRTAFFSVTRAILNIPNQTSNSAKCNETVHSKQGKNQKITWKSSKSCRLRLNRSSMFRNIRIFLSRAAVHSRRTVETVQTDIHVCVWSVVSRVPVFTETWGVQNDAALRIENGKCYIGVFVSRSWLTDNARSSVLARIKCRS